MADETQDKKTQYTLSHLGILRYFVIWGILEAIVYIFTKGDRFKSLTVYVTIFFFITLLAYLRPAMIDFL